ncbi:hypothetical protein M409DRAFT_22196 [Zasmidium cellare ATCC 36951]|uniref:RING-type domain-containing protein n=1 Tax=Zasmidium cellare ATCC 36951 TaxID=1080233 RepID=A0A6A6CPJ8_ZASCE|nr:uncharacterized protein M409DRAFT_22196 [Zasmidium cellare ATCC 36951]KAF2167386.1 hypothetical protein M409DRAFT_22196 [Zasmidium cellare ATCC 36951]
MPQARVQFNTASPDWWLPRIMTSSALWEIYSLLNFAPRISDATPTRPPKPAPRFFRGLTNPRPINSVYTPWMSSSNCGRVPACSGSAPSNAPTNTASANRADDETVSPAPYSSSHTGSADQDESADAVLSRQLAQLDLQSSTNHTAEVSGVQRWKDFVAAASNECSESEASAAEPHTSGAPIAPHRRRQHADEEPSTPASCYHSDPMRSTSTPQSATSASVPQTATGATSPSLQVEPYAAMYVGPGRYEFTYIYDPTACLSTPSPSVPAPDLNEHGTVAAATGLVAPIRTETVFLKDFPREIVKEKRTGRTDAAQKLDQLIENECAACWLEYSAPVSTRCGHIFCLINIVPWVEAKGWCPKCRRALWKRDLTNLVVDRRGV